LESNPGNITITGETATLSGYGVGSTRGALASWTGDNTWAGPVTLAGDSGMYVNAGSMTVSGSISQSGGARSLTKQGPGNLVLTNPANTYSGATIVTGGTLTLNNGNEGSLGINPGSFNAGQLLISNGTLAITGSNFVIDDPNRGVTIGTSGVTTGTFNVGTGLSLTVQTAINGANGNLRKAGEGTFNLTGSASYNSVVVETGVYNQNAGTTSISNLGTGLTVATGTEYNLNGGVLRADSITVQGTGTLNWGSAGIGVNKTNGISGTTDLSSGGYQQVKSGTTATITGNLDTSPGSALILHNSPSIYINGDVRFNNVLVNGNLDLSSAMDRLEVDISPYLLRPFSPSLGPSAQENGSLPLVAVTGTLTGTFDTFTTVFEDSIGFSQYTGIFNNIGDLPLNQWYLQYSQNVNNPAGFTAGNYDLIIFHYRVSGYVPEPETFGMALAGALGLRMYRRLRRAVGGVRTVLPSKPQGLEEPDRHFAWPRKEF
jgi:autotransporter-associated beta strand protein